MANLTVMDLSFNQLSGVLPGELGSLSNLYKLAVNDNQVTGSLPGGLAKLTQLQMLFIQNNELCEPQSQGFLNWFYSIPYVMGTGIACPAPEPVTIRLQSSNGRGLEGATVQYLDGDWIKVKGSTDGAGELVTDIPVTKGEVTFRMRYAGGEMTLTQDVSIDQNVVFNTVSVIGLLLNHEGNYDFMGDMAHIDISYFANGWQPFEPTWDGFTGKELFPGTYDFRVNYSGNFNEKTQDIGVDPVVKFHTGLVHSESGTCTGVHSGSWIPFTQDMELLPGEYSFSFGDVSHNEKFSIIDEAENLIR